MHILGIDIGTTSVKIVLQDYNSKKIISSINKDTDSNITLTNQYYHEQNVEKIFSTILCILKDMNPVLLQDVGRIGISGQMHGVVFWNDEKDSSGLFQHSNLITWMDQRCNLDNFINSLPKMPSHIVQEIPVSSGYGCATIYNINFHEKLFIDRWKYAGNIVDFVVCQICDICTPLMSTQMAHSWGYFDLIHNCWYTNVLKENNFPIRLLPEVKQPGTWFGRSTSSFKVIPANANVYVGMGDLQCSMYHSLKQNLNSAINMSTSSQLVVRVNLEDLKRINYNEDEILNLRPGLVINPFFNGEYMLVGASLNGGNVLENFVSMLQKWVFEIANVEIKKGKIWSCLLSSYSQSSSEHENNFKGSIVINPIIFGERHCPNEGAEVSNIFPFNCNLGDVYKSLCHGLVNNLNSLLPLEMMVQLKVKKLTCSGGLVNRHNCVQNVIQALYGNTIPNITFLQDYDACVGVVDYLSDIGE